MIILLYIIENSIHLKKLKKTTLLSILLSFTDAQDFDASGFIISVVSVVWLRGSKKKKPDWKKYIFFNTYFIDIDNNYILYKFKICAVAV